MREQLEYFEKLRAMRVSAEEALAWLDLALDEPPRAEDALCEIDA